MVWDCSEDISTKDDWLTKVFVEQPRLHWVCIKTWLHYYVFFLVFNGTKVHCLQTLINLSLNADLGSIGL